MKKLVFIFSLLFVVSGCDSDNAVSSNVSFSTIIQKDHYGLSDGTIPQSNLVITNQQEWNDLLTKLNLISLALYTSPDTNVDFTKDQVIAVFDKVYNNGGHSIDITKITKINSTITVKIDRLKIGDLTSVITQPYHIVKIAKTNNKIVFK